MHLDPTEPAVTAAARNTMRANRGRDTGPELAVRRLLHRAGLRYQVGPTLPFDRRRRADLLFSRVGLYVFIDGCYWHGCSEHFQMPKTRTAFWSNKIAGNRARDVDTVTRLQDMGYTCLRFWEHEDPVDVAQEIMRTYRQLRLEGSGNIHGGIDRYRRGHSDRPSVDRELDGRAPVCGPWPER